jgi:nicotinamidase-related amidase
MVNNFDLESKVSMLDNYVVYDPCINNYKFNLTDLPHLQPFPEDKIFVNEKEALNNPYTFEYNGKKYCPNISDLESTFDSNSWAVIVIDMQKDFISGFSTERLDQMLKYQIGIINYSAKNSIPVFCFEHSGQGKTHPELYNAIRSVPLNKTLPKDDDNCFTRTPLYSYLKELDITHLMIMGVNSDFCVKSTVLYAQDRGYSVNTIPQIIDSNSREFKSGRDKSFELFCHRGMFGHDIRIAQVLDDSEL